MNNAYLKKVEQKVEELMNNKSPTKKKKKEKGFLEPKKEDTKVSTNVVDMVAEHVVNIRKKRMELKG